MEAEQRDIRLDRKDAVTVVHLLDALERLARSAELDDHCRDLLAASGMAALEPDGWQARLAAEAAAASGAIRQRLDGYDPAAMVVSTAADPPA